MKKITFMLFIAVIISGCVSSGRQLDPDKVSQIKKGDTGQHVLDLVGQPDRVTTTDNLTVWSYSFASVTPTAATFIPVVGAFAGGSNIKSQALFVTLGPDGTVVSITSSYGTTSTVMGAGSNTELTPTEEGKRPL